jgi:tetratricopeptide (TPR) repeat protein
MALHQAMPDNHDVLLSLGLLSIEIDRNDLAREYLQQLIDRGQHQDQAHYYLGRIQQSDREIMPAMANYEQVQAGDFLLDARIREAGLLAQLGNTDQALEKLKKLQDVGPDNNNRIRVYLAQGEVLRQADRDREAMDIYTSALKDAPENVDLLYARALTAEKLDMLDMAESDLRMVLTHEPDNANALNALGYTLADRTERLQEAREYILKAAELLPDDPAVLDSLGWVYYRLGEMEKSIKWLRKAFAKLEDAEIAAHLGEVLWMNGQLEEAGKIWQRGLQLQGDHPILLDTIKRLKPNAL